jgi:hypothetical protein
MILTIRIIMIKEGTKVHVIPMGLEIDRVLGGLKEFPTNKAILIYGTDRGSDIERRARKNGDRIKEKVSATIDIEELELDIFDFFESTRVMVHLMMKLKREGNSVYVNLSTGNRIVTSAALLACYMTGSHPYYVKPESYSIPSDKEVLSVGVSSVMEIPSVKIVGPSEKGQVMLRTLASQGGTVRHETALIQPLEAVGDFFDERRDMESKKAYLARRRSHLSRVLKTLERDGYVELSRKGRFVNVNITDSGKLFSGPGE